MKTRGRWVLGAILVGLAGIAVGGVVYDRVIEARLLRSDPAALPRDARLTGFAVAAAKPVFASNCAGCHGERMQGNPVLGAPNLTDSDWLYGSGEVAEIERVILYGIRSGNPRGWNLASMPAYASAVPYTKEKIDPLTPPQISDVTEYLLSVEQHPADLAAASRGATIFAHNGECFDCHGGDARGDPGIGAPNLTDDIWLYGDGSRESIFNSIAYGHRGSCPAWIGRLSPVQIRELAIYIHVASHPAEANSPEAKSE